MQRSVPYQSCMCTLEVDKVGCDNLNCCDNLNLRLYYSMYIYVYNCNISVARETECLILFGHIVCAEETPFYAIVHFIDNHFKMLDLY